MSWEVERPTYRLHFWSAGPNPSRGGVAWASDEWRLTDARDVREVLDWAEAQGKGRRIELLAEVRQQRLGVVRLLGIDPTGVRIRGADVDEADKVATLWLRARSAAVPFIPPPVHSEGEVRTWFRQVVLPEQDVWVADFEGRLVGFLAANGSVIEQLYVDPELTSWRIGSQLLDLVKDRHPDGLELWTFEANDAARRFYERHGFTVVERASNHSEEGAADVRYRWAGDS